MQKIWDNPFELAQAIEDRVRCGYKRIVLTPRTALWLAREMQALRPRPVMPSPEQRFRIDMFAKGSRVLHVDANTDIIEIVAWASSALAARAAFDCLCGYEPKTSFRQRRGAWVEAERIVR